VLSDASYKWTDETGTVRIVRVIRGTGDLGQIGGISVPVTSVEDVKSGKRFKAVPFAALKSIRHPAE
jgi:hypothetical protein